MMKNIIENKREVIGKSPEMLKQERIALTEQAGREPNQTKLAEITARIVEIDSELNAHMLRAQVTREVEMKRRDVQAAEQRRANAAIEIFSQHCEHIAEPAIERFCKTPRHEIISCDARLLYRSRVSQYHAQLLAKLSKADAQKQIEEINEAYHAGRDWKIVVNLPQPELADKNEQSGMPFWDTLTGHFKIFR